MTIASCAVPELLGPLQQRVQRLLPEHMLLIRRETASGARSTHRRSCQIHFAQREHALDGVCELGLSLRSMCSST